MSTPTAHSLPCPRCGGRFAIHSLAGEVHCPYCGEEQVLEPQTVQRLDAYREGVDAQLAHADQELAHVAAWAATKESLGWRSTFLPLAVIVAIPFLFAGGMAIATTTGSLNSQQIGAASIGLTFGVNALAISWVVWSFVKRARVRGEEAETSDMQVACPGCGAHHLMQPGKVLSTCTHCGGALAPSKVLIERGLDAAEQARYQATLQRLAAERLGMLKMMNYSRSTRWFPFVFSTPMVLGLIGVLGWASWRMLTGQEAYNPAILIGWGLILGGLGTLAIGLMIRRARGRALQTGLRALAAPLGTQPSKRMEDAVDWLNRHWPATYDTRHINSSSQYGMVRGYVHAFPVMVDFNASATDSWRPARLHLFVAAAEQEQASPQERGRAERLAQAIEHEGWDLRESEAGLLAVARPKLLKQIRRAPESVAAVLPELARITQVAVALGRVPMI